MTYFVGTSGYNYPEWRGSFYPEKFPTGKMLAYYSERFNTVEVNYTFYRMPSEALLAGWAQGTPEAFVFTLKAPRRITHDSKLKNVADLTRSFCRIATTLGSKLGVLLFQLPPNLKRDDAVFAEFLDTLPEGTRAAFEFRHESWLDDTIFALLRERNVALCIAETEKLTTPRVVTADYGYLRLRREDYTSDDVARWAQSVRENEPNWSDAFVYFKHEEAGIGPKLAEQMVGLLA